MRGSTPRIEGATEELGSNIWETYSRLHMYADMNIELNLLCSKVGYNLKKKKTKKNSTIVGVSNPDIWHRIITVMGCVDEINLH